MAKGTVYRHFASKEDLLTAAIETLLADTESRFEAAVDALGGPSGLTDDPEKTAMVFGHLVAGVLPMLLELGARAAKGHEPSADLARRVLRTLAEAGGRPVHGPRRRPRIGHPGRIVDHRVGLRHRPGVGGRPRLAARRGARRGPDSRHRRSGPDHRSLTRGAPARTSGDYAVSLLHSPQHDARSRPGRSVLRARRPAHTRRHRGPGRAGELPRRLAAAAPIRPAAHLLAFYGFARLVDQLGDDYRGRPPGRPGLAGRCRPDGHSPTRTEPGCIPWWPARPRLGAALDADPERLCRPDRRQPPGPGGRRRTPPSTTWPGYCRLSANPVGRLVLAAFGAATPERAALVRRHLHRPAARRALAGRGRGRRAPAGSTCPPRTWTASASTPTSSLRGPPAVGAAAGPDGLRGGPGPPRPRRGRPARQLAAGAGPAGPSPASGRAATPPWTPWRPADFDPLAGAPTRPAPARVAIHLARRPAALDATRRGGVNLDRGLPPLRGDHRPPRLGTFPMGSSCCRPPKRRAMCALYALARRIDDIGDGDRPGRRQAGRPRRGAQGRGRHRQRRPRRRGDDPVLVALADVARRFPHPAGRLRRADRRLRDGRARHRLRDLRRPGGLLPAGGGQRRPAQPRRLRHRRSERAEPLADALGVALQITNILRDIVEDRDQMGRVYLPGRRLGPLRRGARSRRSATTA